MSQQEAAQCCWHSQGTADVHMRPLSGMFLGPNQVLVWAQEVCPHRVHDQLQDPARSPGLPCPPEQDSNSIGRSGHPVRQT